MRISALPTAISNILAGSLLANQSWIPTDKLFLLIGSSSCLYISGMVLNDYCDKDIDAKERPGRPIPSGQVSANSALAAYVLLTLVGLVLAVLVNFKSLLVATIIVAAIFLYDFVLKRTAVAPIVMGCCRSLNILLGASLVSDASFPGFSNLVFWVAAIVGVFICALTWFARNEAKDSNRSNLTAAAALIVCSLAAFAATGYVFQTTTPHRFALFVFVLAIPALYRVFNATIRCDSMSVQQAIRSLLQSLILFDACICILARPDQPSFAMITVALLLPAMFLSRLISST